MVFRADQHLMMITTMPAMHLVMPHVRRAVTQYFNYQHQYQQRHTEFLPLGELSGAEKQALDKLKPELQSSIAKGIDFVIKGSK